MNPFRKRREERLRRERERREARRAALSARLRGQTPPEVEADFAAAAAETEEANPKARKPAAPKGRSRTAARGGSSTGESSKAPSKRRERTRRERSAGPSESGRAGRARTRKGAPLTALRRRVTGVAGMTVRSFGRGLVATRERLLAARPALRRGRRGLGRVLAPMAAAVFSAAGVLERALRSAWRGARRATRSLVRSLDRVITPKRAVFGVAVAAAACLVVSQFVDYHGVQVGQPGYADVSSIAPPPEVDVKKTGEAHSYLLIPVAVLAVLAAAAALSPRRRRLGLFVVVAGLAGIAVSLLVDMPKGLDEGSASVRFSGAHAVLEDGFYAQIAACGVLVYCGLLLGLRAGPARRRARSPRPRRRRGPRRRPSLARSGT